MSTVLWALGEVWARFVPASVLVVSDDARSSLGGVPRLQAMGTDLPPDGGPEYDETVRRLRERQKKLRQAAAELRDRSAKEFAQCLQEWRSPDLWRDRAAALRRQDRAIAGREREAGDRERIADRREADAGEREAAPDQREAALKRHEKSGPEQTGAAQ